MTIASITVVGSVNRDVVLRVADLPRPGETVHAAGSREGIGGKGANQAVAAARLGARVRLVAKVGADGADLLGSLAADGVDTAWARAAGDVRTGLAMITVDGRGENVIVLDGGANLELTAAELPAVLGRPGDVLMVQGEIAPRTTAAAIARAAAQGLTVLLNPAPASVIGADVLADVDVLVPNLGELCTLLGRPVPTGPTDLAAVEKLVADHPLPVAALVVTLGADGALVRDRDGMSHVPAPRVTAVDTVGAGDTFCGALADGLARGLPLLAAAERAAAAAAISVTGLGAQRAMPTAAELARFTAAPPTAPPTAPPAGPPGARHGGGPPAPALAAAALPSPPPNTAH